MRNLLSRMSQSELARAVSASQPELSRYSSGAARPSTPEVLLAFVELGVPLVAWTRPESSIQQCIAEPAILPELPPNAA